MLIQLRMTNGFIPEHQGAHPEIFGKNIFIELASRSFFQDVKGIPFEFTDTKVSKVTCKIHDLMDDVALDSMGKECVAIASEQSISADFLHSTRHLLLSVYQPETLLNASLEKGSPVIQTLICEKGVDRDLQHLSKYSSARALRIEIMQASFLKSKCLHHLRYLDLSGSRIRSLPEDISILYHLQTLNLSDCYNLKRLPKGMKYMTALRHLYTDGCWKLKSMPADLKYLNSLQTLTCFVAGAGSGCSKLGELRRLEDLGGQLELTRLENVKEADAYTANLGNKKKMAKLTLRWTVGMEAQNSDKDVLEGLKPHDGLKVLRIHSYNGNSGATWMDKLQGIVELELSDCKKLEKLPAIWQLPALEVLRLHGLDNIRCLCSCDTPLTCQKLKQLRFSKMPKFETWWDTSDVRGERPTFPLLEKLLIKECKSLTTLPKASVIKEPFGGVETEFRSAFPALKEMELEHLERFQRWEAGEGTPGQELAFPQLEKLTIQSCRELTTLPDAPKLSVLEVVGVNQQIWSLQAASRYITSLSSLQLSADDTETESVAEQNSSELVHGKEKWEHISSPLTQVPNLPASLKTLRILNCPILESIVFGDARASTAVLKLSSSANHPFLPCLESLTIQGCNRLSEVANLPPSIKTLEIFYCGNLRTLPGQLDALQTLNIQNCSKLKSLESCLGRLPSLEDLNLRRCRSLQSLPNGHQAYSSLRVLRIVSCPGIKLLPPSLQQCLDHLEEKELDARYEGWEYAIRSRLACFK